VKAGAEERVVGIVLAAGKGTRMKSALPKVLHPVAGRPMLTRVLDALTGAGIGQVCVMLGRELEPFADFIAENPSLTVAVQSEARGTGDAVASAAFALVGVQKPSYALGRLHAGPPIQGGRVLICAGDTPALDPQVLREFLAACAERSADIAVLGAEFPDPTGLGRIVRGQDGTLERIVEERDATPVERTLRLCNTGVIAARTDVLFQLLAALKPENSQNEYYLTDCFGLARARGSAPYVHVTNSWQGFAGINDRPQLAALETWMVGAKVRALGLAGVAFQLPASCFVELDVEIGRDSRVEQGVSLMGRTRVGCAVRIGANATLTNVEVGDGAHVGAGSFLQNCIVGANEVIAPLSVRIG